LTGDPSKPSVLSKLD